MLKIVLATALLAAPAAAQDGADGRGLHLSACAGCHGAAGIGDGPVAGLLSLPVPDLTRLASRNDGEFRGLK